MGRTRATSVGEAMLIFEPFVSVEKMSAAYPYFFLSTPYTKYHGRKDLAYEDAKVIHRYLDDHSVPSFCPIVHFHHLGELTSEEVFRKLLPYMETSFGQIIPKLPGWNHSDGIISELKCFVKAGKPIYYLSWSQCADDLKQQHFAFVGK